MTIKTQKVLMFIPIIQIVTFFCWAHYLRQHLVPFKHMNAVYLKQAAVVLLTCIPITALHYIFRSDFIDNIAIYICGYFMLLGWAAVVVFDQEKCQNVFKYKRKK